ncbi:guanosine polyphosphate pyrophosphohydrolase [Malaciobacter pacificus]|jgi:exopolyphosphatase/guanosine-5'-triphosphate,3'-diphosphate pyrophosphatase|uniref:Guanosine-5'-triphosphate, 3'-diphosphate pyrophosphatase n=1 Tax=Malaciobacter pacificus TaxID=1080223 RepID=A0A5C2H9E4_9BACT|nr:Ppx/GppA phosphatase family protein [Malaciobacter pacificus]QEP34838.1 guanosine-5'-triphosphate, 3'-diphosphate pyrophosphatase [Malaciobacter pacificus]GGD40791.1 guanosine polyphosphate pyrophosphohydrolase [Malaciobacter pacificus]
MAKVTTIIDIGSNSMRMVVLQKSSRYAFSLINETKSRVKISEGCYENNGNLQEIPMQRAYESFKSFLNISNSLKSRKIICVATSALRDAPNAKVFLNRIKNDFGINIKVIDGEKEAYYGGVAALNLIDSNDFVTVDIGGGSTEFSFIHDGNITKSISLDLGTVRLKELYFNKNDVDGAKKYILDNLKKIFDLGIEIPQTVVGIGGSIRALTKMIMKKNEYPLDVLHGYKYKVEKEINLFKDIVNAKNEDELRDLNVKKDRLDTIKEGTFIFKTILEELNTTSVITSGAGVREGVYLADLLRNCNHKFPANFNVSVRSLLDRYGIDKKQSAYLGNNAAKIFDVLKPLHELDEKYKSLLIVASKLHSIGSTLNFYKSNDNAFDYILNGLSYDFLHSSRVVVAHTIKFSKKSLPTKNDIEKYEEFLPDIEVLRWMSFMISLNLAINLDYSRPNVNYDLIDNVLNLELPNNSFLITSNIEKLESPKELNIKIL